MLKTSISSVENTKYTSLPKNKKLFLFSRWIFLGLIVFFYYIGRGMYSDIDFLKVLTISIFYNFLIGHVLLRQSKYNRWNFAFFVTDVSLVSIYIHMSNGVDSDIFYTYFFGLLWNKE